MQRKIKVFIQKEPVLFISMMLALLSMIFIKPDKEYSSYIDYRTLAILFTMMTIMSGLSSERIFQQLAERLTNPIRKIRSLAIILIMLTFILSMLITNDVALITIVPFTIVALNMVKANDCLINLIVLETLAANLGSMLTPMGNPQNLYLYSLTDMTITDFICLMLPYSVISLLLILVLCFILIEDKPVKVPRAHEFKRSPLEKTKVYLYILIFIVELLAVAKLISYLIPLVLILIFILIMDREIIKRVDYSLILTFVCLFIFIGNIKRISGISHFLMNITKGHEIISSVILSQIISNVPAAILLSKFTDKLTLLIIGTNLGGLGTLIASMASLISFKFYLTTKDSKKGRYLAVFSILNIIMLIVLLLVYLII